jgi:DNA-binding HxlR family transcriptional regulator
MIATSIETRSPGPETSAHGGERVLHAVSTGPTGDRARGTHVPRTPIRRVTPPVPPLPPDAPAGGPEAAPARPPTLLDPILHERMRLALATALAVNPTLTFTELKRLLGTTDGNLSLHARRLESVGYVSRSRTVAGRTSRTEYRLTPAGRRALARYLDDLEALVRTTRARTGL